MSKSGARQAAVATSKDKALDLVGQIARMHMDGESAPGVESDDEQHEMSGEDAVDTMNALIEAAREILK